jgi:hypothetical protein
MHSRSSLARSAKRSRLPSFLLLLGPVERVLLFSEGI